ncbi:MAG: TIGR03915 family putative DNA repair protein [Oscillospiraceae bacterium]|nr:TIGR03915 family putative DNA repair protein [Oscillospiraceae bacterium]
MFNWKHIDEVYIYDGTFFGLLSIVFDSYANLTIPIKMCTEDDYEHNILDKLTYIETDEEKSRRVFDGIVKNVSFSTMYTAYTAFLSGQKNKEISILKYLIAAFKTGPEINNMLSIDYVLETMKLRRNASFEAHRLKGLVKFRCVSDNQYYAPIHPDNNVIEIVGKHFVKRLPTQNFILHDKNRNISFVYDTKEFRVMDVPNSLEIPEYSEEEKLYQTLWKTFFKTIAIKERTNKKLQMQFMPKKYWKDLIEME